MFENRISSKIVSSIVIIVVIVVGIMCWRYYQNTHVYERYYGTGQIIGYEETDTGLIVMLQVKSHPYHPKQTQIRILIDEETKMLFPNVVYALKNRTVGFEIEFTSREFWLPDAMGDEDYLYPMFGCVIEDGEWFDLTQEGIIDETEYTEFEKLYKTKSDTEWLGIQ